MLTELVHESQLSQVFAKALPSAAVKSFIELYREKKKEYTGVAVRFLPNVAFSLLFNLGNDIIINHNGRTYTFSESILIPSNYTWTATGYYFEIKFSFGPLAFLVPDANKTFFQSPVTLQDLVCPGFIESIEKADSFQERTERSEDYFSELYSKNEEHLKKYRVVEEMIGYFMEKADTSFRMEAGLKNSYVSSKSIQRYFLKNFGISPKAVYCILRMRKALGSYFDPNRTFRLYEFDYYDYSHFYKEIKKLSGLNLPQLKGPDGTG